MEHNTGGPGFCLLQDWKVVAIAVDDPLAEKMHDIGDVDIHVPGASDNDQALLSAVSRWSVYDCVPMCAICTICVYAMLCAACVCAAICAMGPLRATLSSCQACTAWRLTRYASSTHHTT